MVDQNSKVGQVLQILSSKAMKESDLKEEDVLDYIRKQHKERASLTRDLQQLQAQKARLEKKDQEENTQIRELKEHLDHVQKALRPVK